MATNVITYKGFQGSVEVSLEDDCVYGKILHINDLITYESDNPRGITESFKQAVDSYLTLCQEEGRSPDKPYSGSFNIRIGEELHKEAVILATQMGCKLNELIKESVRERVCRGAGNVAQVVHNHRYAVHTGFSDDYNEESQSWKQNEKEIQSATLQ